MENGVSSGPGEELKRLGGSDGVIQQGLDVLAEKKGSVDQASICCRQQKNKLLSSTFCGVCERWVWFGVCRVFVYGVRNHIAVMPHTRCFVHPVGHDLHKGKRKDTVLWRLSLRWNCALDRILSCTMKTRPTPVRRGQIYRSMLFLVVE